MVKGAKRQKRAAAKAKEPGRAAAGAAASGAAPAINIREHLRGLFRDTDGSIDGYVGKWRPLRNIVMELEATPAQLVSAKELLETGERQVSPTALVQAFTKAGLGERGLASITTWLRGIMCPGEETIDRGVRIGVRPRSTI
jgi:hypothetical protein